MTTLTVKKIVSTEMVIETLFSRVVAEFGLSAVRKVIDATPEFLWASQGNKVTLFYRGATFGQIEFHDKVYGKTLISITNLDSFSELFSSLNEDLK